LSPFIGRPEGFSSATLELLDKALSQMWNDMRIETKTANGPDSNAAPVGPSAEPVAVDAPDGGARAEPSSAKGVAK
jgi:hypothetical protein